MLRPQEFCPVLLKTMCITRAAFLDSKLPIRVSDDLGAAGEAVSTQSPYWPPQSSA
jgi:hypothetical protein